MYYRSHFITGSTDTKLLNMNFDLVSPDSKAVAAIIISITGFYFYHFITGSKKISHYFKRKYFDQECQIKRILFNKIAGLIFFGILPSAIFFSFWTIDLNHLGISIQSINKNWIWLIGLPILIIIINYFSARSPDMYDRYPQMRIKNWNFSRFLLSATGWAVYLISYESLFRGILLVSCAEAFGVWPAIAINIAIYSAIHLPNGIKESIGAIPFGFIACWFVLNNGSLLVPIVMHISLSVSTEFFTIRNNPEMSFKKKLK